MKYVIIFLAGVAACFAFMRWQGCGAVTTVKRDTTYRTIRDTIRQAVLTPYKVKGEPIITYRISPTQRDTIYQDRPSIVDTGAILRDYFSRAYYNDTVRVKYGFVFIRDTISWNRIAGRSVMTQFQIPTITNTVTRSAPSRGMLFLGPDIGFGVGVSAAYKSKGDHLYSAGYMLTARGGVLDLSYKWKISFK